MMARLLVCGAGLLGLVCLLILALNWVHGLRINSRKLNLISVGLFAMGTIAGLVALHGLSQRPVGNWPVAAWLLLAPCLLTGLVGFPAVTIKRLVRGPLSGTSLRVSDRGPASTEEKERWIGTGWRSYLHHLPMNESLRMRFEEWTVVRPGLPPALEGLSILLVGDLHFSKAYQSGYFETMLEAGAAEEVDLTLFVGDLADDLECLEWVDRTLAKVRGKLGSFAVLGNHDHLLDAQRIGRSIEGAGFELIEGRWGTFEREGLTIAVGGTSAPWGPLPEPIQGPPAAATLFLSHSPDQLYRAAAWGFDLMFSGHTHAGQVRLPIIGPMLMPSQYSRRFESGFYEAGKTLLYVSRGMGAEVPLRLGCMPELTRLVFRAGRGTETRRIETRVEALNRASARL